MSTIIISGTIDFHATTNNVKAYKSYAFISSCDIIREIRSALTDFTADELFKERRIDMRTNITIRMASETDAEELLKLYTPYVTDTAITFEYDVPSVTEFAQRIKNTLQKYPYIVVLEGDNIVGYAYASAFKARAAYDWAIETTVYLKQDCRGKGFGKLLYLALENILKRQNILNMNACIAYTSNEDIHLDNTSTAFHQHLGYSKVAHFTKCGYKFGTWYDMIWMEKLIGEHSDTPARFIPITEIRNIRFDERNGL